MSNLGTFFSSLFRKDHSPVVDAGSPDKSTEPPALSYSADQPIASREQDRFSRWPFASRIAETLASRADPSSVVVGIYGPWGDGKTSVLALMESALKQHVKVVPVRFNPWYFNSHEALLRGFFESLAEALGKRLINRKEQIGETLKKYGGILSVASLTVGGTVAFTPGAAAKDFGEGLSTVELTELRRRLEAILKDAGLRVVVMIDDIDRLDRDDIHAIFKLVKLSADFQYTSYVLAFDDQIVADSLSARYGSGNKEAGLGFLEKIVQVPLHLPAADAIELRSIVFDGVQAAVDLAGISLTREQAEAFGRHFVDSLEIKLTTPRQAKLYVNAVMFALPLLKGEVNPVDHMLIEGIRVFYPKLYAVIRDNPQRFLTQSRDNRDDPTRTEVDEEISRALATVTPREQEQIKDRLLEVLFPRFGNVGYGRDWDKEWIRDKRICADDYFKRYFAYSVPPGDVSDTEVLEFLNVVAAKNHDEVTRILGVFSAQRGMEKLFRKLRNHEDTIDAAIAPSLAEAVLLNGALYPRDQGPFTQDWTFMQVAILAAAMLKRIQPGDGRNGEARRLMSLAEPLGLGARFLQWTQKGKDQTEGERILPETVEKEMGALLAQRIQNAAIHTTFYKVYQQDTPMLLWIWEHYGDKNALKATITASIVTLDDACEFLRQFIGRSWGMESGLSRLSDFNRQIYDSISAFIEPASLLAVFRVKFGDSLDSPQYHYGNEMSEEYVIAHQFAFVHLEATNVDTSTVATSTTSSTEPDANT